MYYVRLKDDKHGRRWKVREAVSLKAAVGSIRMAMATGSIGDTVCETTKDANGVYVDTILASVIRVNSDNTEAEPYKAAY
jgi:hypothetical protein